MIRTEINLDDPFKAGQRIAPLSFLRASDLEGGRFKSVRGTIARSILGERNQIDGKSLARFSGLSRSTFAP